LSSVLDERGLLVPGGAHAVSPTFVAARQAIDANLPFPVRIVWPNGGGAHFVCIFGYSVDAAGGRRVTVFDPLVPHVGSGSAQELDLGFEVFCAAYPSTDGIVGNAQNFYELTQ